MKSQESEEVGNEILMKCGHSANALDSDGQPCCAICAGVHPEAYVVEDKPPDLKGRLAQCTTCNVKRESSYALAFFKHNFHYYGNLHQ